MVFPLSSGFLSCLCAVSLVVFVVVLVFTK